MLMLSFRARCIHLQGHLMPDTTTLSPLSLTEGDGEAIRRAASILRYFGDLKFLQSPR